MIARPPAGGNWQHPFGSRGELKAADGGYNIYSPRRGREEVCLVKIYTKPAVTFVSLTSSERIGSCHMKITGANETHLYDETKNCIETGIIVGFDTLS